MSRGKVEAMTEQRRWLRPADAAALPGVTAKADTLRRYAADGYLPYSDPPIPGVRGWWEDEFRELWASRLGQGSRSDLDVPRWVSPAGGGVAHLVARGRAVCGREVSGREADDGVRRCRVCTRTRT